MKVIKCPICKHFSCEHKIYLGDVGGAFIPVEEYKYCDKCGYTLEMAYSSPIEFFSDIECGYKDGDGNYHKKNKKRHMRIRRKYADREVVKQIMRDRPYGKNYI